MGTFINHAQTYKTFGQLRFNGKAEVSELDLNLRQNGKWGLFFEANLPVRKVRISQISYQDLSLPRGIIAADWNRWKQFLNNLDSILANYNLAPIGTTWSRSGVGDLTVLLGWQKMFDDLGHSHLCGITLKTGVLCPTGRTDNANRVFSLPIGYNDHWGAEFYGQIQAGIKTPMHAPIALVFRAHGGATYFWDKTEKVRHMKTFPKQNGYLKLAFGKADEEKGTLWHLGSNMSLEHITYGLNLRVGYSYTRQEGDILTPKDTTLFNAAIVNSDSTLHAWYVHAIHFMIDYDFSQHMKKPCFAPRTSVFYNIPFHGKNAFKMGIGGGSLGIDVQWKM